MDYYSRNRPRITSFLIKFAQRSKASLALMGKFWGSVLFVEDDGLEDGDLGSTPPGVARQAGLETALVEEGLPVPAVVDRHLGEQDTPGPSSLDDDAVGADLDQPRVRDLSGRRQDRDLEPEVLELAGRDGPEAGILEARENGRADD